MKTIEELEEECRAILKRYSLVLPTPWQGYVPVWHGWHEPNPIDMLSYRQYLDRVAEIEKEKPEDEKLIRFLAIGPVQSNLSQLPKYTKWGKAYAEWRKADAEWRKADAEWGEVSTKSTEKNQAALIALEARECPGSTWDWTQNKMTFKA